MLELFKGVTANAWTLLVGWIFPAILNVLLFGYVVLPSVTTVGPFPAVSGKNSNVVTLLVASLTLGLLLNAVQTPIYRVLEGYQLWWRWGWLNRAATGRQVRRARRLRLLGRLANAYASKDPARIADSRTVAAAVLLRPATPGDAEIAAFQHTDRGFRRLDRRARQMTVLARGLLQERLQRYPDDFEQFLPTRLGNAIRRIERYAPGRFQLDQQVLWYELTTAAPAEAAKAVDQARSSVDFFVALLAGHLLVAASAVAALVAHCPGTGRLAVGAAVAGLLAVVWYHAALVGTDNWAAAVRALVNVGRKPLAASMGLTLPADIADERRMWSAVGDLVRAPYTNEMTALDEFRARP
jgi:hypothetical protein